MTKKNRHFEMDSSKIESALKCYDNPITVARDQDSVIVEDEENNFSGTEHISFQEKNEIVLKDEVIEIEEPGGKCFSTLNYEISSTIGCYDPKDIQVINLIHEIDIFRSLNERNMTYFITTDIEFGSVNDFMEWIKLKLYAVMHECLKKLGLFTMNFVIYSDFVRDTKTIGIVKVEQFGLQTNDFIMRGNDDIILFYATLTEKLNSIVHQFEVKSRVTKRWRLKKVTHFEMNISKFNPLLGSSSSCMPLPKDIANKRAVRNMRYIDVKYNGIEWALLSALYPEVKNLQRMSSREIYRNELNFNGIKFPIQLRDIPNIEYQNGISISVFGLLLLPEKGRHRLIGPLYYPKKRKPLHVNLLYYGHYRHIKDLPRLIRGQQKKTLIICDCCLRNFLSKQELQTHQENYCHHLVTELPSGSKIIV